MTTQEKINKLLALPGIVLASKLPTPAESLADPNKPPNPPRHAPPRHERGERDGSI